LSPVDAIADSVPSSQCVELVERRQSAISAGFGAFHASVLERMDADIQTFSMLEFGLVRLLKKQIQNT